VTKRQMGKYSTTELSLIMQLVEDSPNKTLGKIVADLASLLDRSEFSIESKVKEIFPDRFNRKPLPPTVPAVLPKKETLAERLLEQAALLEKKASEIRKVASDVEILERWASDATAVRKIIYNVDMNGIVEVKK